MSKYRIGYALSGGGAKGFAHAGAIKALEEKNIRPDVIAGTSAGSVVGAFYSAGISPDDMCNAFRQRVVSDFIKLSVPRGGGFFKSDGFIKFLQDNILYKNIEDLPLPLYIIATDFDNGKMVVFDSGELATRVMASSSVPIFFKPMVIDGVHYVDGGLFKNFPVSIIRDMCDFVIGINVSPMITRYSDGDSVFSVASQAYHYMSKANTLEDKKMCDILIEIEDVSKYGTYDLKSAYEIFEIGYNAMKKRLESIDLNKMEII